MRIIQAIIGKSGYVKLREKFGDHFEIMQESIIVMIRFIDGVKEA